MSRWRGVHLSVAALVGMSLVTFFGWSGLPLGLSVAHAETPREVPASDSVAGLLQAGSEVERPMASGQRHQYHVVLRVGEALHVIVSQQKIDVSVTLFDPGGQGLLTVDGPNGPNGQEALAVVAAMSGRYRLELTAPAGLIPASSGGGIRGYQLQVKGLGPASKLDRARAAAMRLYARAESRRREETAVSLDAALQEYREALNLFLEAREPLLEARTRRRIGQVFLAQGEPDEAAQNFEQALDLYREHGSKWERAPLYNDTGVAYRRAGKPERARELFERLIADSSQLDNRLAVASAWNNLGRLHAFFGEMQLALAAYRRALEEWRLLGDPIEQARVLHNLGVHYVSLGRHEEGLDFLHRALMVRRDRDRRTSQAVTLTAIGWALSLQGDLDAALVSYEEALKIRREVGDKRGEAVTLDQRGTVLQQMGRYEEALDSYSEALQRIEGSKLSKAYSRVHLGQVQMLMDRPQAARESLQHALQIFRKMGIQSGQSAALASIAQVERRLGRLTSAREHLEAALEIVESVRGRLQSRWLRSSYLAVRYADYSAYVDLLMQLNTEGPGQGYDARAFEASERARARTLLESLAETRAGVREAAAPELLDRERILWAQINAKESRRMELLAADSEERSAGVERELRSLLLTYESLQGEIHSAIPRDSSESQPLSLEEIRREVLDDETLLLAYSLGRERSFLWVVGGDFLDSHELPPRSEIDELARRAHELMPRSHVPGIRRQAAAAVDELSQVILGEAAGRLGRKRLLIVGDGALHYVPFGALSAPQTAARAEARRPLLADHEIVHLPSASVLALLRRQLAERTQVPGLLAVVADPVFQPDDPRLSREASSGQASDLGLGTDLEQMIRDISSSSLRSGGIGRAAREDSTQLRRLPFASVEADAILALAPEAESFRAVGPEASRELILSGRLNSYRIVHFATHGLLNAKHPALSGIVLSLFDRTGRPREGPLRMHEIFDLRLSADLVVLSACRTALGKEVRGEGLVGLTHGFFYAGAARLVVSFWNVNDRATAELMTRFYRGMLLDGLPPARALRAAQLSMLDESEWQAPYYWAGFTLQGEWR